MSYFKLTQTDYSDRPREIAYESKYESTNRQPEYYYDTNSDDDYGEDDTYSKKEKRRDAIALTVILVVLLAVGLFSALAGNSSVTENMTAAQLEKVSSEGYEYRVLSNSTLIITGYTGSEIKLEIPSTIDGYKVTRIDEKAFSDCTSLTSITIPDSVTSISAWAFNNCDNLTIYGSSGSAAETYAEENSITFKEQ